MYAVRIGLDGGATTTVFAENLVPDPLFPDQIVLAGIDALSWPVEKRFLHLDQWSFKRSAVLSWMRGDVRLTSALPDGVPERDPKEKLFGVLLKMDSGGSGMVLCEELAGDSLFPGLVTLKGVVGLSLPTADRFVRVDEWSLNRSSFLSWMLGSLKTTPDLDWEGLLNGERLLPWPPGTTPCQLLATHEEALELYAESPNPEPESPADPS